MRVGPALIGALCNRDRVDPIGQRHGWNVAQVREELLEPEFQIQPVPQDQVSLLRTHDVLRRRLVAVDLCPRLGDRDNLGLLPSHVSSHVGEHGKGRHHLQRLFPFLCVSAERKD